MKREDVKAVVHVTLLALSRIAKRTRTQTDDLLMSMLRANEDRLVDAVMTLLNGASQPPTEAQVTEALMSVGITV